MKKTIFALLLVVALVAVLAVPAIVTNASAAEYNLYHCECGAKQYASADATTANNPNAKCMTGCDGANLTWEPIANLAPEGTSGEFVPMADGNYYLPADTEIGYVSKVDNGVTIRIDLNGHTLARTKNRLYQVNKDATLVITDTSTSKNGVLASKQYAAGGHGAIIYVSGGTSVVRQYAGTLDAARAKNDSAIPETGGAVSVEEGTYYMYGGTITGGYALTGGNVALIKAGAKFEMYNGTIQNGMTKDADSKHGGNFRVANGAILNIYGGTVKDGTAQGASKGGNIMATGEGTSVTIGGNTQILGGTASAGGASIWINTGATLTVTGGRVEKDVLISGNAKVTGGQFDTTDMSAYFQLTSTTTLVGDLGAAGETLTLTEDTYIDLNGHNILSNIDTGAYTLYLSDSATADYSVADGKYGKVTGTITGNVARDHVAKNQRYLVVKTADGYSAHRIYLAVTSSIISGSTNGGVAYKTVLKCDEVVAGLIADYGAVVNTETVSHYGAGETCTIAAWGGSNMNEKVSKVIEVLKSDDAGNATAAETAIAVNAYITLNDSFGDEYKTVNSAVKERSMQEMIVKAVENWGSLTAEQQATLKAIYSTFNNGAYMDDKNKWPNVADKLK